MNDYHFNLEKDLGGIRIRAEFKFEGRGIVSLFGPSGAGKTSIINMAAGLMTPDRGRIVIGGNVVFDSEKGLNLPPYKRRVGYVFQDARLFPHYTVRGNLNYGRNGTGRDGNWIDFDDVVDVLGIRHLLKRRPHHLSGGEKQRVAIGRGLLTGPKLLLMDEPVSSVDESRKQDILNLVAALPERFNVPILFVTHSREEIESLSADVLKIQDGMVSSSSLGDIAVQC